MNAPFIGHNGPPLSIDDFLEGPDAPTDSEVLEALRERWIRRNPQIAEIAERAEKLAGNKDRLPAELDERTIDIALDLIAAIDQQASLAAPITSELPAAIKQAADSIAVTTKSLTLGVDTLEKAVRPLVADWLKRDLDARNAGASEPAVTNVRLGRSGARAAITLGKAAAISDEALIPREWLVPDMKRIDKAIAAGSEIAGIAAVDMPALRVTWPEKVAGKSC